MSYKNRGDQLQWEPENQSFCGLSLWLSVFFVCYNLNPSPFNSFSFGFFFFLKNNQKILKPLQRLRITLIHTNPRSSYLPYSLSLSLSLSLSISVCLRVCERELLQGVSMATNIGMMDSAYFVGRNEILTWINNRLQLNLSRVEEVLVPIHFLIS